MSFVKSRIHNHNSRVHWGVEVRSLPKTHSAHTATKTQSASIHIMRIIGRNVRQIRMSVSVWTNPQTPSSSVCRSALFIITCQNGVGQNCTQIYLPLSAFYSIFVGIDAPPYCVYCHLANIFVGFLGCQHRLAVCPKCETYFLWIIICAVFLVLALVVIRSKEKTIHFPSIPLIPTCWLYSGCGISESTLRFRRIKGRRMLINIVVRRTLYYLCYVWYRFL